MCRKISERRAVAEFFPDYFNDSITSICEKWSGKNINKIMNMLQNHTKADDNSKYQEHLFKRFFVYDKEKEEQSSRMSREKKVLSEQFARAEKLHKWII